MDHEIGMAVEDAGVDQPDRRHDQRELAPDGARGVVGVEGLGIVELQRGMHEHEQPAPRRLGPEGLQLGRVEEQAVDFRGDDHAREAQLHRAARQFPERVSAADGMHVGGADEAPGVAPPRLVRLVIDEA